MLYITLDKTPRKISTCPLFLFESQNVINYYGKCYGIKSVYIHLRHQRKRTVYVIQAT